MFAKTSSVSINDSFVVDALINAKILAVKTKGIGCSFTLELFISIEKPSSHVSITGVPTLLSS
jgi:hypothetical protein